MWIDRTWNPGHWVLMAALCAFVAPCVAGDTKPALSLPADTDASTITLTTVGNSWSHRFPIDLTPKAPAKVTVMAGKLYMDNQAPVDIVVKKDGAADGPSQTFDIADWPASVVLSASNLSKGTYTGTLKITIAGGADVVRAVKLTRTPANYTLGASQKVSNDGLADWNADFEFAIPIAAPNDHDVTLTPQLFEFRSVDGSQTSEVKVAELHYSASSQDVTASAPLVVPAKQVKRLMVQIPGPLSAGKYQGDIKLVSRDLDTQTFSFEMSVRRFWAYVLLPVWLGAGLSLFVKYQFNNVRPRTIVRQIAAQLQGQGGALSASQLTTFESTVLNAIAARIGQVRSDAVTLETLPANWVDQSRALLDHEAAKLRAFVVWTNARRILDSVTLPDAIAGPFRDRLTALGNLLSDDAAIPPAHTGDFQTLLNEVEAAQQTAFRAALDNLSGQIDVEIAATAAATQARAMAFLEQARVELAKARSTQTAGDLRGMGEAFDEATADLFKAKTAKLKPNVPNAPAGAQIASAGGYLGAPPDAMLEHIDLALNARSARDVVYYFKRVKDDADEARASAQKLLGLGAAAQGGAGGDLQQLVDAPQTPSDVVPTVPLQTGVGLVGMPQQPVIDDPAALLRKLRGIDRLTDVLTIALTGALGVVVLWNADPTWGKPMDWFIAFFWGLGLGEVSKNTFTGVANLRTTLSS